MNNYSSNMLKTFEECQQKFFLKYVERFLLTQRSEIFEKGKKIHALANYHLKGFDISKMEQALDSDEKKIWESLKSNEYFKLKVVNTEYNLSCKIDKYWIGGRLDALMLENEIPNYHAELVSASNKQSVQERFRNEFGMTQKIGEKNHLNFIILDYKTGNIPQNAEQDFQTIIYLLCTDKFLTKKNGYNSLKFAYLGLKNNINKEILLTENLKKQSEEKVIKTCKKIDFAVNSGVFEKNKENCEVCEYNNFCN